MVHKTATPHVSSTPCLHEHPLLHYPNLLAVSDTMTPMQIWSTSHCHKVKRTLLAKGPTVIPHLHRRLGRWKNNSARWCTAGGKTRSYVRSKLCKFPISHHASDTASAKQVPSLSDMPCKRNMEPALLRRDASAPTPGTAQHGVQAHMGL